MGKGSAYVSGGDAGSTGGAGATEGQSLQVAEEYLKKHNVQVTIQDAVNKVLIDMPADPINVLAQELATLALAKPSTNGNAPSKPPVQQPAANEEEIKAQGEKVRSMKEALKANPAAHTKEELDAEIAKLKELKSSGGGSDDSNAKKDKKSKDSKPNGEAGAPADKGRGKGRDGNKGGDKAAAKLAVSVEPVTGARDFYPDEMRVRNWLFGNFREVARGFAFQEYDAPVLEHEELYKRKVGSQPASQSTFKFSDTMTVDKSQQTRNFLFGVCEVRRM